MSNNYYNLLYYEIIFYTSFRYPKLYKTKGFEEIITGLCSQKLPFPEELKLK
jgi:hypothetical protein